MVECQWFFQKLFVIQIEQNVFLLDRRNVWEIDTGKCIVAFRPLLLRPGSRYDLAVKNQVDPIRLFTGSKS